MVYCAEDHGVKVEMGALTLMGGLVLILLAEVKGEWYSVGRA